MCIVSGEKTGKKSANKGTKEVGGRGRKV